MFTLKNYLKMPVAAALVCAAGMMMTSCINEDLEPCEARYGIRFRWDNNLLGADAFSGNVHSVAVYGFDSNGVLAFVLTEKGDALAQQGYTLPIDGKNLAPGDYSVVAWCGLDNDTPDESFIVSDVEIGKTTIQELNCRLERQIENGTHYSREQLYDLYHGTSYGITIYDENNADFAGDHVYPINLTKDTNNVRVMLQQFGKDVNVENFTFSIEAANGELSSSNDFSDENTPINYEPFYTTTGVADATSETRADGAISGMGIAIANMKMSRLLYKKPTVLTIRNTDGKKVLQVPMIDYALLAKDFEYNYLTEQEYLDRQDSYRMIFFLDSNGEWINTSVVINSWTVYT
ncbi:MAG: FimB/Mfa2 family fimbrial subunit, partial [Muribaculaceae bacterium]|nr:FimB/Mfa2 family fimbrial subunit [Muribaculaceae bacterium]